MVYLICSERMQKNVDPIFIKHISSYYAESYDNQHLFSDNATENERLTSLFSTYDMFEVRFLSIWLNSKYKLFTKYEIHATLSNTTL